MDALCNISGWQNLETLHMTVVPCEDRFLIEIGKRCKNLQKLLLRYDWLPNTFYAKISLFEMLKYCGNLRDLTIESCAMDQDELFASLVKNAELERLKVNSSVHSVALWISSLENLVRQCAKLTTIICRTKFKTEDDYNAARSAVER